MKLSETVILYLQSVFSSQSDRIFSCAITICPKQRILLMLHLEPQNNAFHYDYHPHAFLIRVCSLVSSRSRNDGTIYSVRYFPVRITRSSHRRHTKMSQFYSCYF